MRDFNRRYLWALARLPISVAQGVCAGSAALVLASGVVLAVKLIALVWTGFVIVYAEATLRRGGVREGLAGISNPRGVWFPAREWAWSEIERFQNQRTRVFLITRDQRAHPLVGIGQGKLTRWAGGETRDIVSVLNERLPTRRATVASSHLA